MVIFLPGPLSVTADVWVVHPAGSGDAPTIKAAIDSIAADGVIG
jgi:hypothetical protein